ncbi:aldehyde dehydrogenase family protein [Oharaeibacter diazotrophicus]|uniref:aldehyde dehydrogenase (NAD(+)) n=1 Tax=Oharaeibacter diazotrophicus TaxID=1920512 RepID=A0A4R6RIX3_9HYPH|nr:aldehyde dehydrogenase family protein [Oharaeibacter diazotrophicus]TDP86541.1 aldehyde dehydrogenase (NAD+) [Oharaeibacter diazotrophicus]BBE71517.1 3-succinoylsemialdehyde-pyridine dehydrogenase [Pleomorphomonas sp. SM30]GLS78278.1 aldehyde dehydrogenase [Oharaeibacter diazotrophicus]
MTGIPTTRHYIDGAFVEPHSPARIAVVNPATEEPVAEVAAGDDVDVDRAVAAARRAFPAFAATRPAERVALLRRIADVFEARRDELASAVTTEMGSPPWLAREMQTGSSIVYFRSAADVLERFAFDEPRGETLVTHEPIGVAALITPWNWPLNQIVTKLGPALAAGCTVVLKPSELSPLSALLLAEVLDEAGVPPGVFNLVNGTGPTVGAALSAHPDVDMVSFTGSTRAGIAIARAAADTVKRVHQELGGKSANVVLPDADLDLAVTDGVRRCFINSGQSCIAPTRMLVHRDQLDEVLARATAVAAAVVVGDPTRPETTMGPVAGAAQFAKIQGMIETGIAEGARLVVGGPGRPEGLNRGFYVRPTIFADVTPAMTIAREEIFGPVLSVMTYADEDEAVAIANDSLYGLAGYVHSRDLAHARAVARRIRAGRIFLNDPFFDFEAPFGGYKRSGNGRELGVHGLMEFLEVKAILGYDRGAGA